MEYRKWTPKFGHLNLGTGRRSGVISKPSKGNSVSETVIYATITELGSRPEFERGAMSHYSVSKPRRICYLKTVIPP